MIVAPRDADHTCGIFARSRHARYIEPRVVYHVISRTRNNLFLFRPDLQGELRRISVGVYAKAKELYPNVANFGSTLMSNHLHNLLSALQRGHQRAHRIHQVY